eukprot:8121841-Pyramimonas_sp.AAC.1
MAPCAGSSLRVIGHSPMWASGLRSREMLHRAKTRDAVLLRGARAVRREVGGVLGGQTAGRIILEAVRQPEALATTAAGRAVSLRAGYND